MPARAPTAFAAATVTPRGCRSTTWRERCCRSSGSTTASPAPPSRRRRRRRRTGSTSARAASAPPSPPPSCASTTASRSTPRAPPSMARPPAADDQLARRYGPHPLYAPPGGWQEKSRRPPDRLVKTHCCFCGQQCGIQLEVRDNAVVGFEPWEDFPFNRGMLCPKGVRRYLQGSHPDRLLSPLVREEGGFREAGWDEALDRVA